MIVAGKAGTQCFRGTDIIIVKNKGTRGHCGPGGLGGLRDWIEKLN